MKIQPDDIKFEPHPTDPRFIDLTDQEFNGLMVLGYAGKAANPNSTVRCLLWYVRCHCGNVFIAASPNIKNGNTKSCGCQKYGRGSRTHGLSHTREHRIWRGIKTRCSNPRNPNFQRYGARGIRMDDNWFRSFEVFLADMGEAPSPTHTVERIGNSGHYTKDNCIWATRKEQNNNRRNNVRIEYQGITLTIAQWADKQGLTYASLQQRLKRGWNVADALTMPPQNSRWWKRES